ncbi:MAG: hypothetical protein ABSA29_20380 [Terriglobales bacterium]
MIRKISVLALALASLTAFPRPARANADAVQFGEKIHATAANTVHDAVCFFCSVQIDPDARVTGDIVVFFGDVHIAGVAQHDVVNFFGDVKADDNASIGHDLVSMFGGVRLGQDVSVGGDMVAMFGAVHQSDSVTVRKDRVVQPAWLFFVPLALLGCFVVFIVSQVRANRRRHWMMMQGYPPPPIR